MNRLKAGNTSRSSLAVTSLGVTEARRLALVSQGLHKSAPFGRGKAAVLKCLDQLGYIQIDTISVINRSHHHAFWTRVPTYLEAHLDSLQREAKILEYWAHAAAYLPMQDYRYCLPYMQAIASGKLHWRKPDRKTERRVLERIRAEGPMMARDFEHSDRPGEHWGWNWKPAKIALEQLFIEGRLIVSHRIGFQKVYDLPERVLPAGLDTSTPDDSEFYRYLISRAIRAHGLVTDTEIGYLRKGAKAGIRRTLQQMLSDNEIIALSVGNIPGHYYTTAPQLEHGSKARITPRVSLLSPFDNAAIQRRRLQSLFDYDYQIECYVPAAKRRFGYFCLPILYGQQLVGRLDPKADRQSGQFLVKKLYLENPPADIDTFTSRLAEKLLQTASFNGCRQVVYRPAGKDSTGRLLASKLVALADGGS